MVGSVAVLSDVHGMAVPLEAVLAEPDVASADLVVVTGDHLWGPLPGETLALLTDLGERVRLLRGNADREVLAMSRGADVGLADDPASVWGAQVLTQGEQRLVGAMPETLTLNVDGFGTVLFCHATPRDDEEVVLVDSRLERWQEVLADLSADVTTVVCGHTHMPYVRIAAGRTVVNPGSVGLPYGRPGAHWALLHDGAVTLRRTLLESSVLVGETARRSSMPGVEEWLEEMVRTPADDAEVLAVFGPRDGR